MFGLEFVGCNEYRSILSAVIPDYVPEYMLAILQECNLKVYPFIFSFQPNVVVARGFASQFGRPHDHCRDK